MPNFQEKFMNVLNQTNASNLVTAERYKEDSCEVVEKLFEELSELEYVKAQYETLKDETKLSQFFKGIEQRFENSISKYTKEFTHEIINSLNGSEKRLKSIFIDEGITEKNWHHHVVLTNNEDLYHAVSKNTKVELGFLSDLKERISKKTTRIIKSSKKMKLFWGIIIPIIMFLGSVILGNKPDQTASVNSDIFSKLADKLNILEWIKNFQNVDMMKILLFGVFILVIIAIWMTYYKLISYIIHKREMSKLHKVVKGQLKDHKKGKNTIKENYYNSLKLLLEEIMKQSFLRYKPLIDEVSGGK